MEFKLPELPYKYDALEPFIDAKTMEIHYTKHHQAYTDKLNEALAKHPELKEGPIEDILSDLESIPEDIRTAVKNNGGGYLNHREFWKLMRPPAEGGGGSPKGDLGIAIGTGFGGFDEFKKQFGDVAAKLFGSGWAWLVMDSNGKLGMIGFQNQDTPLSADYKPVLCLDVWEHAYYLKYQNKRSEYIENWWNVVNWDQAEENYTKPNFKRNK